MSKKRLLWQIYPIYILTTVISIAAIIFYSSRAFENFYVNQAKVELKHTSRLVDRMIEDLGLIGDPEKIDSLCKQLGKDISKRITVILPSGAVIGDSEANPPVMESHADRPEVRSALAGETGVERRISRTLGKDMIYVAIPIRMENRIVGVVRTSMPFKGMAKTLRPLYVGIALGGLVLAMLVAAMIFFFSRRILKPLEKIRAGAQKLFEGDFSHRVSVCGSKEVQSLASTMNRMAQDLETQMNRLKELENMRREFVANVSHELKTPVTSIKGFAETLRDGALQDPEKAQRFLNIIASQASRLTAIIEDLLNLSRIEQESEKGHIRLEQADLKNALETAVLICREKADSKKISIELKCPESLTITMNSLLLEHAIANLIDNAIKYSDAGKTISIEGSSDGESARIVVEDSGCGISKEHIPRIFERFYRVDKGRSRELGGTGLGLAIVKHIVGVHGGIITVDSSIGLGSRFTIRIPMERR